MLSTNHFTWDCYRTEVRRSSWRKKKKLMPINWTAGKPTYVVEVEGGKHILWESERKAYRLLYQAIKNKAK